MIASLSNTAGTVKWTANGDAFSNVVASDYWSSTTYEFTPGIAWGVLFSDGFVILSSKTNGSFVLPVRGP